MKKKLFVLSTKKAKYHNLKTAILLQLILGIILIIIFAKDINKYCSIGIINDEFGYWGIAASWSGKNWSGLLSSTPYYSFGYSALLVPIFMLNVSAELMYQIAQWGNVILILISFFLACWCGKKILSNMSNYLLIFLCFIITLYSNNIVQAKVAWTETLLYCLYWLLLTLLIRVIYHTKKIDIFLYAMCNVYMYYVHQRTIGVLLSSILIVILLFIYKKISREQIILFGITLMIFMIVGSEIKSITIDTLFTNKQLVSMNDYTGQTQKMASIFTSISGIWYLIKSIFGKLYYIGSATFLIGFVSLIVLCKQLIWGGIELAKRKSTQGEEINIVQIFILISFSATFLISAISMYLPYGRLDLLLYGRYVEFTIGPILLVGLGSILQNKIQNRVLLILVWGLGAISILVDYVWTALETTVYNGICISVLDYFLQDITQVHGVSYKIVISLIPFILIYNYIQSPKWKEIKKILFLIIIAFVWVRLADYEEASKLQYSVYNNVSAIADEIELFSNEYNIYMVANDDSSGRYAKYLQFFLYDVTVYQCELSEIEEMEAKEKSIFVMSNTNDAVQQILENDGQIIEETDWLIAFKF